MDENDENVLDDDLVYKVIGLVYLDDDIVEESDIIFKINLVFCLGSCFVIFEMGYVVMIEFMIFCKEWEDEDLLFMYEFM